MEKEISRQFIHFSGIFLIFIAKILGKHISISVSIAFFIFFVVLSFMKKRKINLFPYLINFADRFERKEGYYEGALYFFFSASAIFLLFPEEIALISIFVLCVYDSIATLSGKFLGKRKIFFNKKSLEGVISGFAFTIILGSFLFPFQKIFIATVIGAAAELIPKINDNISIPFSVAVVFSLFDLF